MKQENMIKIAKNITSEYAFSEEDIVNLLRVILENSQMIKASPSEFIGKSLNYDNLRKELDLHQRLMEKIKILLTDDLKHMNTFEGRSVWYGKVKEVKKELGC